MIHVTTSAVLEMRRLLGKQGRESWGVRVGVKGGGCSGLSYVMDLAETADAHDRVLEVEGIKIYCDPKSYLYLNDMTLDFSDQPFGGGFQFNLSPANSPRACACGTSHGA
jgi:iron-sulfur cluster assembly protein